MTRSEIVRNPYVWGFLIGIVTLTAIRPFLRHIPEPPPVIGQVPPFTLVDVGGRAFGSAELRGEVYVASFFFTSCRAECPETMKGMARLQDGFNQRGIQGIHLVSISVDPERDTPDVLRAYQKEIGVDPSRWTLLTGDPGTIRAVVVDGFKPPPAAAPTARLAPIDVAHIGTLALVDGAGGIRGYYGVDELGLDEVYNRAQHVLRQQKAMAH